jgi:hypothetical protein
LSLRDIAAPVFQLRSVLRRLHSCIEPGYLPIILENQDDSKSTTGYVIYHGKTPVALKFKKQPSTAQSSTEAEIIAMMEVAQQGMCVHKC